jgi:transposase
MGREAEGRHHCHAVGRAPRHGRPGALPRAGLPKAERPHRASPIDPFLPFVLQTLEQYPRLTASRLHAMVRERGYSGGEDHFRHLIAHYRPRPQPEAYLRLKTLPGEQSQVDWGHFGKLTLGKAERTLQQFSMPCGHPQSRYRIRRGEG